MSDAEQERNRAAMIRIHEAVNSRDLDVIARAVDEVYHPDVRFTTPIPLPISGVEAIKQLWAMLLRAYPDVHVDMEEIITDGDKFAVRNTVTATHLGEHMGIAPTGRTVTYGEMFIGRFVDGKVAEVTGVVDVYGQLRQLGGIAVTPETAAS